MRTALEILNEQGKAMVNIFPGRPPGLQQANPPTKEELQQQYQDMANAAPWCLIEKAKKEQEVQP